ncbi:MAG: glycosyltransferase family 9 protein [Proteobacteria bacterium]|nr:glycosyltransferase family 9 protein [Pseudomonadota bacterium]
MQLLFITSNRLGDAVLSTGLLGHLVERDADVEVTVACGPVCADIFGCLPGLRRVIALRKRPWAGHWRGLWQQTVATRWDEIVDLRSSPMTHVLRGRRKSVRRKAGEGHRVAALARWYGLEAVPAPRLWSNVRHAGAGLAMVGPGGPVLGIGPAANWQGKIWPPERFAELAGRLTGPSGPLAGGRIAVFGGPGEEALVRPVLEALPGDRTIDLVGGHHLLDVAEALRRCALFVGNDSGLMHLSAAARVPTLGLFGPSRVEHYAPWGPFCEAVTTATAYDDLFGPGYHRHTTGSLMGTLSVDMAEAGARRLLERIG